VRREKTGGKRGWNGRGRPRGYTEGKAKLPVSEGRETKGEMVKKLRKMSPGGMVKENEGEDGARGTLPIDLQGGQIIGTTEGARPG